MRTCVACDYENDDPENFRVVGEPQEHLLCWRCYSDVKVEAQKRSREPFGDGERGGVIRIVFRKVTVTQGWSW